MVYAFSSASILEVSLIFARIGSLAMLFPLIGERFVPMRIRLVLALFLALLLAPPLKPLFNSFLSTPDRLIPIFLGEVLIGLIIGLIMRMIMAICDLASQFITQSLGLSLGEMLNPSMGQSTPVLGTFLTLLMLVSFFALDGHHAVIRAMSESYRALPPAEPLALGDFSQLALAMLTHAFEVALRIAAPFIFFGILINFGLGLISKLMPMVPITFLAVPVSVLAGIFILFMLVDPITRHFVDDLLAGLSTFAPG
jgi:flagellar biosynthetic protein FliR